MPESYAPRHHSNDVDCSVLSAPSDQIPAEKQLSCPFPCISATSPWGHFIDRKCWYRASDEAQDLVDPDVKTDIQGYDIDAEMVNIARENAKLAGVDHLIHFQRRPVAELSHPKKYGFLITNPPYGERLEDKKDLPALYRTLGERYAQLDDWSMYLITSYENAQQDIGRKADKNRKIYNGMMKTYFYQYQGAKPPKRAKQEGQAKR